MYIRTLLFALAMSLTSFSFAAKMYPGVQTVIQSDGTTLQVLSFGDEYFNYFTTIDGALLIREGNNFFVAAVSHDGQLSSTGMLAHDKDVRTSEEKATIAAQDWASFRTGMELQAMKRVEQREPLKRGSTFFPHTGSPKALVILVEFSDTTFKFSNPKETFNKFLNHEELFSSNTDKEMGRNYGSVKRYFTDMSFGQFTPQFDVYGPVNLNKPLATYGAGSAGSEKSGQMILDACRLLNDEIDYSRYDSNNDGYIDIVYILYAGYSSAIAGNSSDCIHPKSGTVSFADTFDGKKICRYGMSNELIATPAIQAGGLMIEGIGVFCHEFSHCMGLPDLYPTPGSVAERTINHNLDYWSLMDAGEYTYNGYRPTEYTAWEREAFGWLVIDTLKSAADITLKPLSDNGKAYRIVNNANDSEYYILENIQKRGWNKSAKGHGMTVIHVDYKESAFTVGGCPVNSTAGHPHMTIIPADGIFMPQYFQGEKISSANPIISSIEANAPLLDRYDGQTITSTIYNDEHAGDPFPGITGNAALTDTTTPASRVYAGDFMGKSITDIIENPQDSTVSFKFMGGAPNDTIPSSIKNIETIEKQSPIYSISGHYMGTQLAPLPDGVYIINRRKVVK